MKPESWRDLGVPPAGAAVTTGSSPGWVLEKYRRGGGGKQVVAWRRGAMAGVLLGETGVSWSAGDHPVGMITPWIGKAGGGVRLSACSDLAGDSELVVLWFPRHDAAALAWLSSKRDELKPLFPGGLTITGVVVDS